MSKFNGLFSNKQIKKQIPKYAHGDKHTDNLGLNTSTAQTYGNQFNIEQPWQTNPNAGLSGFSINPTDDVSVNPNAQSYVDMDAFNEANPTQRPQENLTPFDKSIMELTTKINADPALFRHPQNTPQGNNMLFANNQGTGQPQNDFLTQSVNVDPNNVQDNFQFGEGDNKVDVDLKNTQGQFLDKSRYGEEVDYVGTPPQDRKQRGTEFLNYMSQYDPSGVSTDTALFKLGQSLNFNADDSNLSKEGARRAKGGNLLRGIGALGKSALGVTKSIAAGAGYQNRLQEGMKTYNEEQRKSMVGRVNYAEDGGVQSEGIGNTELSGEAVSKLDMSKYLTGEYITGLPRHSEEEATAEVEKGEYILDEEGVRQVVGNTHENKGEKVNIADGTKIVSNNLKLSKDDVKKLKADFDMKVSTKDTYAKVVEKFTKKIGLTKLNAEHEVYNKKLEDQEAIGDEATAEFNREFISGKLVEIESKKQELLPEREQFSESIFQLQEESKGVKGVAPQNIEETSESPIQEEIVQEAPQEVVEEAPVQFEDGGMQSRAFQALCKKHNLTESEGRKLIQSYENGGLQKYEDGGAKQVELYKSRAAAYTNKDRNFRDLPRQQEELGQWMKDMEAHGVDWRETDFSPAMVGDLDMEGLEEVATRLQDHVAEKYPAATLQYAKSAPITETGIKVLRAKIADGTIQELVGVGGRTQADIDDVIEVLKDNSIVNTEGVSRTKIKSLMVGLSDDEVKSQNFQDKAWNYRRPFIKEVRFDNKADFDKFQASNQSLGDNGLFSITGQDNLFIKPIFDGEEPKLDGKREFEALEIPQQDTARGNLLFPDQSVLPPEGLQAHLKVKRRFEDLESAKISFEDNLVELARQEQATNSQLNNLPDAQRRAGLASVGAASQQNINKIIAETNKANAMNQQTVDQFNIGQHNKEENFLASDALDYERRQLTALGKTQDDLAGYFDYYKDLNVSRFKEQSKANLLDSIYENFNITPKGGVATDPNKKTVFTANRSFLT